MFANLGAPPGAPQLHRWADWAELIAFTSAEFAISVSEFAEATERTLDTIAEEGTVDQDPAESGDVEELAPLVGDAAKFRDAARQRSADIFDYLRDRAYRYGAKYPFAVDEASKSIELRDRDETRDAYLFLLSCSTFRYLKQKTVQSDLANRFEVFAEAALWSMVPATATVERFGPRAEPGARYSGTLKTKIETLAADLGETALVTDGDFEKNDRGDGGLDLVAWADPGDTLAGRSLIFAQVAATPGWISKQHSSGSNAWTQNLTLKSHPQNVVFIPFDYRSPGHKWYAPRHIQNSILMDRQRILNAVFDSANNPTKHWVHRAARVNVSEVGDAAGQSLADI